jgi:hypothetical protein
MVVRIMGAEKLSISMESELLKLVRSAAAEEGVSVSTWLTEAARERARQRALAEALDDFAARFGSMTLEEAREIVAQSRKHSIVIRPRRKRT